MRQAASKFNILDVRQTMKERNSMREGILARNNKALAYQETEVKKLQLKYF